MISTLFLNILATVLNFVLGIVPTIGSVVVLVVPGGISDNLISLNNLVPIYSIIGGITLAVGVNTAILGYKFVAGLLGRQL